MKYFTASAILVAMPASMALSGELATRNPSPVIKAMANGMTLLKPLFGIEAKIQASVLGFNVDELEVSQEIAAEVESSPVVIYTYGLSPFSVEATAILDATGCDYNKIEVGAEWFLLDGKDSVKRVLLSEFVDNGATSLPKVFVNGECIGGCAELAESVSTGKFNELVKSKGKPKKKSFLPFSS
jgi:glutaredoxin-related protein